MPVCRHGLPGSGLLAGNGARMDAADREAAAALGMGANRSARTCHAIGVFCSASALDCAPPYNLARLSFEWSAVVARESLSRSLWNTGSLAQLRQHPPPGPRTGTGGDAHGPIDARTDRGGADLLREHEVQPAVLGRDIRPDRPHHPQGHQSRRQSRARGHHPASRKGED